MLASYSSKLLLLASVAMAQVLTPSNSPSVVTFISISPVPTTEGVFTIQTSVPSTLTTHCYEVCIQEPCPPCGLVTSEGSMGIPPGETPLPSSLVTDRPSSFRLSTATTGAASASSGRPSSSAASPASTASRSGASSSSPPQQSTGAAPSVHGERSHFKLALAVSGMTLVGATLILL